MKAEDKSYIIDTTEQKRWYGRIKRMAGESLP